MIIIMPLWVCMFAVPELSNALALSNEDFQAKYGFAKPAKDSALVTYCMKGGRAEQARNIFQSLGYTRFELKVNLYAW